MIAWEIKNTIKSFVNEHPEMKDERNYFEKIARDNPELSSRGLQSIMASVLYTTTRMQQMEQNHLAELR